MALAAAWTASPTDSMSDDTSDLEWQIDERTRTMVPRLLLSILGDGHAPHRDRVASAVALTAMLEHNAETRRRAKLDDQPTAPPPAVRLELSAEALRAHFLAGLGFAGESGAAAGTPTLDRIEIKRRRRGTRLPNAGGGG